MKKVVFLNHWARQLGGAEYSLLSLLQHAAKQFDCCLITTEDGPLAEEAKKLGVSHLLIPCSQQVKRIKRGHPLASSVRMFPAAIQYLLFVIRLNFTLKKIGPDLIHANVPKSHVALGLIKRAGLRPKGIIHIREIFAKRSFAYRVYSRLFTDDTCGIAVSKAVYDHLPQSLQKRTSILYNGIEIPRPPTYGANRDYPLRLLYLGRVVPWKGCHELLDILEELLREKPNCATMSLVGDTSYWSSDYREDLRDRILSSPTLRENAKLVDHQQNIGEVFRKHDVFCTAAHQEPFGRSTAEAQAYGLPVIAYNSGGVNEIVINGDTGILVAPGDRSGFKQAIITFAEKRSYLKKMGTQGAKRAAAMFDGKTRGHRLVDHLNRRIDTDK